MRFADIPALQHPSFQFRHGSAKLVDPVAKVAEFKPHQAMESENLEYDYLIAATGLRRAWPSVPQALTRTEYLDEVRPHIEKVCKAGDGVAVIGGGEWYRCRRSWSDNTYT